MSFPKTCGKCRAIIASIDAWTALPSVGVGGADDDDLLEYRNCACGNTLVLVIAIAIANRGDHVP